MVRKQKKKFHYQTLFVYHTYLLQYGSMVWYLVPGTILCSSNNDGYWQQQLSTHGDFHLDVARQYEKNCLMNMTHSKLLSWPDARSVKIIQTWAFYKCPNLRSNEIPNDSQQLKESRSYTFQGCHSLQSIIIPEGITTRIGWQETIKFE